jgi:hypothetical protein
VLQPEQQRQDASRECRAKAVAFEGERGQAEDRDDHRARHRRERERHHGQKRVGLGDVQVERVGKRAGGLLVHDPDPAEATPGRDHQEGNPAVRTGPAEQPHEPIDGTEVERTSERSERLQCLGEPQAERRRQPPDDEPEEVEEDRIAALRRQLVFDQPGVAELARPRQVLRRVRHVEHDPHEHLARRSGGVRRAVGNPRHHQHGGHNQRDEQQLGHCRGHAAIDEARLYDAHRPTIPIAPAAS